MYPTVHIVVKDVNKRKNLQDSRHGVIWRPLDQLTGYIVIKSLVPILLDEVTLLFQGTSRVWTKAVDIGDGASALKREHRFLSQLHEPLHLERLESCSSYTSGYIAPYHFVIPRWILVQSCDIPDQCLSLPPSMGREQVLTGTKEAKEFTESHIAYYLHLKVVLRISETCLQETYEAWEEIKLLPYTEGFPPTGIRDFPADFVQSISNNFKTSMFSRLSNIMTISTDEPAALQLGRASCTTNFKILVEVEAAPDEVDTAHINRLISRLQKLKFGIKIELRAKTFYSTTTFPKLPSQSSLSDRGQLRLYNQLLKLDALKARPVSWNSLLREHRPPYSETGLRPSLQSKSISSGRSCSPTATISPSQPSILPRKWSATIQLPIILPSTLLPTFCSAIIARQYSLAIRAKAIGITIKPFSLEVPIQVIYPPPEIGAHSVTADEPPVIRY